MKPKHQSHSFPDEAFDEATAVLALPLKYGNGFVLQTVWKLNEEIVVESESFESFQCCIRHPLMGALLIEQDEKWRTGRKYFDMQLYYQVQDKESKSALLHRIRIIPRSVDNEPPMACFQASGHPRIFGRSLALEW